MRAYKKRLVDVHGAITTFICERGYAPTSEDIGKILHMEGSSVRPYMQQLESLGILVMPQNNNGVMEIHGLYDD